MTIPAMPARKSSDGPMKVTAVDDDTIRITVETNGVSESVTMSRYNAWRVFGAMSLFLDLPLSKALGKAIKF